MYIWPGSQESMACIHGQECGGGRLGGAHGAHGRQVTTIGLHVGTCAACGSHMWCQRHVACQACSPSPAHAPPPSPPQPRPPLGEDDGEGPPSAAAEAAGGMPPWLPDPPAPACMHAHGATWGTHACTWCHMGHACMHIVPHGHMGHACTHGSCQFERLFCSPAV